MIVYTLQRLHNFTHFLVISSLAAKRLEVSILPNVHFFWCTDRRSPHRLSHRLPARKTSTLRFHRYRLHCPTEPPLVPWLGVYRPSPKVWIIPSFPYAKNIYEAGKTTCYSTKPTHIRPMIGVVNMVTRSMNRSLRSLAGTTTI
jgi:hypothetical protein